MTEQNKMSPELKDMQDFIVKNCAEADSINTDEKGNLAFHAGPDPIKKLTAKQVKEYHLLANAIDDTWVEQYNQDELRKEAEIDAQQKQIYENIENAADVNIIEHFKNMEDTLGPEIHLHDGYSAMSPEFPTDKDIPEPDIGFNPMPTVPATRYKG